MMMMMMMMMITMMLMMMMMMMMIVCWGCHSMVTAITDLAWLTDRPPTNRVTWRLNSMRPKKCSFSRIFLSGRSMRWSENPTRHTNGSSRAFCKESSFSSWSKLQVCVKTKNSICQMKDSDTSLTTSYTLYFVLFSLFKLGIYTPSQSRQKDFRRDQLMGFCTASQKRIPIP